MHKRNYIYSILDGIDIWALNLTRLYLLIKIQQEYHWLSVDGMIIPPRKCGKKLDQIVQGAPAGISGSSNTLQEAYFNLLENAIENELKRVFVCWPS